MDDIWQPAVILPIEMMCDIHRSIPNRDWERRKKDTGKTIMVRKTKTIKTIDFETIPNGDCQPLEVKNETVNSFSRGMFSCEVSTD